jgi:hypothetical protein
MGRAAAALAILFLVIYLPDAGHGFVQDDFRWIVESRVGAPDDLVRLLATNIGFYRPLVYLTFTLDQALWGAAPVGYALTNLVLCLAVAGAFVALARAAGLSAAGAVTGAGAWLLNFHAVNMAVLWLSGRTALLVSLFALLAAHAMFHGREAIAGGLALLAMLSKEEAVALPALFTAHVVWTERHARALRRTIPLWIALAVYLALRVRSGAFWPGDAPSFYRFTFAPLDVARNIAEYADRAGTFFVIVILVVALATGVRWRDLRGERSPADTRTLAFAGLWIVATYALTVFLPVRSSLYALLPSLGSALVVAIVSSTAADKAPRRFRMAALGLLVAGVALVPVYWSRNERWVRPAELSEQVLTTIFRDASGRVAGHVVLIDDPQERFNLTAAFGGLFPEALRFRVGPEWTGEIVDPDGAPSRPGDLLYRLAGTSVAAIRPQR